MNEFGISLYLGTGFEKNKEIIKKAHENNAKYAFTPISEAVLLRWAMSAALSKICPPSTVPINFPSTLIGAEKSIRPA